MGRKRINNNGSSGMSEKLLGFCFGAEQPTSTDALAREREKEEIVGIIQPNTGDGSSRQMLQRQKNDVPQSYESKVGSYKQARARIFGGQQQQHQRQSSQPVKTDMQPVSENYKKTEMSECGRRSPPSQSYGGRGSAPPQHSSRGKGASRGGYNNSQSSSRGGGTKALLRGRIAADEREEYSRSSIKFSGYVQPSVDLLNTFD